MTGFKTVRCFTEQWLAEDWCYQRGGRVQLPPCDIYLDGEGETDAGGAEWNPGAYVSYDPRSGTYHAQREFVDAIKQDWTLLANDFGYLTATESGYYMLERVALGDLSDAMGLRSGDLLIDVNGHDLATLDAQMAAYAELQDETTLILTVERNGELVRKTYVVIE